MTNPQKPVIKIYDKNTYNMVNVECDILIFAVGRHGVELVDNVLKNNNSFIVG